MTKYVIISSNGHPDYEWYIPIVRWAWKKLGWETIVMRPIEIKPYREVTITQCIRLYAACDKLIFNDDDLIMTSDADMIPLSNYWNPDPEKITTYGHDLTGFKHVPICYIAMSAARWRKVMNLEGSIEFCLNRDLKLSKAKSFFKWRWWYVDQDIITERLSHFSVSKINRGIEPGSYLPLGRMDRAGMKYPSTLIDFHAPKEPQKNINEIKEVILKAFGECPEI